MKIRQQIPALIITFGVLFTALVGFISLKSEEMVEEYVMEGMSQEAMLILDRIDRNLFERYHDARAFTLSLGAPTYPQLLEWKNAIALENNLNTYVQNYQVYRRILVIDRTGTLIGYSTKNPEGATLAEPAIDIEYIQQQAWFDDVLQGNFLVRKGNSGTVVVGPRRDLLHPETDSPTYDMIFAAPIRSKNDDVVGVWVNVVDFGVVEELIAETYRDFSEAGFINAEFTLLDAKGNVIVDYDPTHRIEAVYQRDFAVLGALNLAQNGVEGARLAVAGLSGSNVSTHFRKQISQVTGYAHSRGAYDYPGVNWSALVRVPVAQAFAVPAALRNLVFYISMAILAVLMTVGLIVANRITKPLAMLTHSITQLSRGELDAEIARHERNDEIREINDAVNKFRDKLVERERLQAETHKQRKELELQRRAINATATGIVISDVSLPDQPLIYVNRAFENLTGYSADEVIGRNCRFLQGDDLDQPGLKTLRDAIKHKRSCTVLLRNYRKDGAMFYNNLRIDPVFSEHGELTHFIGVQTDVTEIKRAEAESARELERIIEERTHDSKAAEIRMRTVFDTATDGTIVVDKDGMILDTNRATEVIFGRVREEIVGTSIKTLIPDLPFTEHDHIDGSRVVRAAEVQGRHKSGRSFPLELSVGQSKIDDEQIFVGVVRDITEHKEALKRQKALQAELVESEQVYRAAFDQAAVGIARIDLQGEWLAVNKKLCEILGYSGAEILKTNFMRVSDVRDVGVLMRSMERMKEQGEHTTSAESRFQSKHGDTRWTNTSISLVRDQEGEPKYFIVVLDDVTDTKKVIEDLNNTKQQREELITGRRLASESGGIANWSWDLLSDELHWDESMYAIYGIEVDGEQLCFDDWRELIHPDDTQATEYTFEDAVRRKEPFSAEFRICKADSGDVRWVTAAADLMYDEKRRPIKMFGVTLDVSEDRRIRADLEQKTKAARRASEAKSRFLATMSHEIRTPLNGVIGMIDLLRETELSDDQNRMTHTIRDSSFSLLEVINDILDFSKIEAGQMDVEITESSLLSLIERSADALWVNASSKQINVYIEPQLDIEEPILIDPVRTRQVLINLLGNAIKFSQGLDRRGQVWLRTHLVTDNDSDTKIVVEVEDNGVGMTEEQLARLFQPFTQADSTTTRKFGGTGLGLIISKSFVELMSGHIEVTSEYGKGSTFRVVLPYKTAPDTTAQIQRNDLSDLKILLAVDDAELQSVIEKQLRYFNCSGTCVSSHQEAELELSNGEEYDIVLLDNKQLHDVLQGVLDSHEHVSSTRFLRLTYDPIEGEGCREPNSYVLGAHPLKPSEFVVAVAIVAGRESPVLDSFQLLAGDEEGDAKGGNDAPVRLDLPPVLVAEDQPINREVIGRQLKKIGCRYEMVENGLEALEKWSNGQYGMLLTDCHMPMMDGYELTAAIRAREAEDASLERTAIVAITANALAGEAENCLKAGMDDYISKPVELQTLKTKVFGWLEPLSDRGETVEEMQPSSVDTDADPTVAAVDLKAIVEILGTDEPEIVRPILQALLNSLEADLENILAAIEAREGDRLRSLAHSHKGAANSCAALPLGQVLYALEQAGLNQDWDAAEPLKEQLNVQFSHVQEFINAWEMA